MSKFNVGGAPTVAEKSDFWKPVEGKDNLVVLLSDVDPETGNVVWSDSIVKMFQNNKFGKTYPLNASWIYFGKGNGDPRDILAPELALGYSALIMVAYEDSGTWKLGIWQASKAVHRALITANSVNDTKGKYILVKKEGKNWGVTVAGKMKVLPAALEVANNIPSVDAQGKILGDYESVEDVWEMLRTRANVQSNEELLALFGRGSGAELL